MANEELKVLIIDDSDVDREILLRFIEQANVAMVKCFNASTGAEGTLLAIKEKPHLVFIDYMLPDISGLEVIERLSDPANELNSELIVVTGQGNESVAVAAMKAGAMDYLVKSDLSIEALTRIVLNVYEKMALKKTARAHKQQADYLETHDRLTGLHNRQYFEQMLIYRLAETKKSNGQLAVLLINIDNFQNVNDVHGHEFGDELIKKIALQLGTMATESLLVARFEGDEFALLVDAFDTYDQVSGIANDLINQLLAGVLFDEQSIRVSVSIGIACYPESGENIKNLMQHADIALHRAKNEGKSTYHFYSEDIDAGSRRHLDIENQLHLAVENNELYMVYQPIIDIESNKLVAFEALIRWESAVYGNIPPEEFIEIAERSYLIQQIGNFVIDTALTEFKAFLEQSSENYKISVNISSNQLKPPNAVQSILERIEQVGLVHSFINLELTERAVISDLGSIVEKLVQFQSSNIGIYIDDFGTGNSSLTLLQKLPVNTLKIDKSFTDDVLSDIGTTNIVKSVIALCETMGFDTIVEGVETKEQSDFIKSLGAKKGQGYYYARPMKASELLAFEKAWRAKHDA